jgi:hypothetical protein
MKYARIVDNKVFEIFAPHSGGTIEQYFTPEIVALFIECPEEVENNWTYKDGEFIAPPIVIPEPELETDSEIITE